MTLTLYPAADAFINQYQPDRNYGSSGVLKTRNEFGEPPPSGKEGWAWQDLVEFDLSVIPPDTVISSATLRFYYYDWWDNDPAGRALRCYRLLEPWNEATVTWNTRPAHAGSITSQATVPSGFGWMTWDVTADVQAYVDGTVLNHGWKIRDETTWGTFDIPITRFRSKEYGTNIPTVTVDFTPPP